MLRVEQQVSVFSVLLAVLVPSPRQASINLVQKPTAHIPTLHEVEVVLYYPSVKTVVVHLTNYSHLPPQTGSIFGTVPTHDQ